MLQTQPTGPILRTFWSTQAIFNLYFQHSLSKVFVLVVPKKKYSTCQLGNNSCCKVIQFAVISVILHRSVRAAVLSCSPWLNRKIVKQIYNIYMLLLQHSQFAWLFRQLLKTVPVIWIFTAFSSRILLVRCHFCMLKAMAVTCDFTQLRTSQLKNNKSDLIPATLVITSKNNLPPVLLFRYALSSLWLLTGCN